MSSEPDQGSSRPSIARIGIVTVSDRAHRGEYEDRSGPAVHTYLNDVLVSPWEAEYRLVPDERPQLEQVLCELADARGCAMVITTGGTGPAPRDITPDATRAVLDRELPGFGEAMRAESLKIVPTAVLSRQLGGHRGSCLILNVPGNPKAVAECLDAVFAAVPDCIDLLGGPRIELNPERMTAYRPHP